MEGIHLSYVDACDYIPCAPSYGSLLNGAIHWLAFPADENRIVAFDLTERSFSDIPLPVDFERGIICSDLRVIGGFLSLWVLEAHAKVMWMMKEYKVQSSWTKTVVVSLDDIATQYFYPICSSKSGHIVGTDGHTGLVKCDNRGQLLEYFTFGDYVNERYVAMYTESILPLPGVQAEEDD